MTPAMRRTLAKSSQVVKLANGHILAEADRSHIQCDHAGCTERAYGCEYMRWKTPQPGIAFYKFCETHWRTPGPYGDTPEERATKEGAA